jgi:hypothetical protein
MRVHQFTTGSHPPHQHMDAQLFTAQPAGMRTPPLGQHWPPGPQPGSDPQKQPPELHVSKALQAWPQPPQFAGSVSTFTQSPPQQWLPVGHPVPEPHMQAPAVHVSP